MWSLIDLPRLSKLADVQLSAIRTVLVIAVIGAVFSQRIHLVRPGHWLILGPALLVLALAVVRVPLAANIGQFEYQQVASLVAFLLVLLAGVTLGQQREGLRTIAVTLITAGVFSATWYAVQLIRDGVGATAPMGARSWAMTGPTIVTLLLVAGRFRSTASLYAALCGTGVVLTLIALSLSRTAYFTAVLAAAAALIGRTHRSRVLAGGMCAFAFGLYVVAMKVLPRVYEHSLGGDSAVTIGTSVGTVTVNTSGRAAYWQAVWEYAQSALWFGHGPGMASAHLHEVYTQVQHPHNDYLRILADYGMAGLSLFGITGLVLMAYLWSERRRQRTDGRKPAEVLFFIHAAPISLGAFAALMITDNPLVYDWVYGPAGLISGIALGLSGTVPRRLPVPQGNSHQPWFGSSKDGSL